MQDLVLIRHVTTLFLKKDAVIRFNFFSILTKHSVIIVKIFPVYLLTVVF